MREAVAAFAGYSPEYARFVMWAWFGLRQQLVGAQQQQNAAAAAPPAPCSMLLVGPSGTGKTRAAAMLIQGIRRMRPGVRVVTMTPSNTGDAADVLEHMASARGSAAGCIVLVDDADVIFPDSDGDNDELDLLARAFASCVRALHDARAACTRRAEEMMPDTSAVAAAAASAVIVLVVTKNPSALHPIVKEAMEVSLGISPPSLKGRIGILQALLGDHAAAGHAAAAAAAAAAGGNDDDDRNTGSGDAEDWGGNGGGGRVVVEEEEEEAAIRIQFDKTVSIAEVAGDAQGLTGAELEYLCSLAAALAYTNTRAMQGGGAGAGSGADDGAGGEAGAGSGAGAGGGAGGAAGAEALVPLTVVIRHHHLQAALEMVRGVAVATSSSSSSSQSRMGCGGRQSTTTGNGGSGPWSRVAGYAELRSRLSILVETTRNPTLLLPHNNSSTAVQGAEGAAAPALAPAACTLPAPPSGVLLYGPSGVGKSLIARAMAATVEGPVFAVGSTSLVRSEVGESERAIRDLFAAACKAGRAAIILDDVHVLFRSRSDCDGGVGRLVTTQLLLSLDAAPKCGVVVIATTSRPDLVDTALLRPGRIGQHVHVAMPDMQSRAAILLSCSQLCSATTASTLQMVAAETEGYTAADLIYIANSIAFAQLRARSKTAARVGGSMANPPAAAAAATAAAAAAAGGVGVGAAVVKEGGGVSDGLVSRLLASASPSVAPEEVRRLAQWSGFRK